MSEHKITQKILVCENCGCTPDNGENMWQIINDYWCDNCYNDDEITEIPEFKGTRDILAGLTIL